MVARRRRQDNEGLALTSMLNIPKPLRLQRDFRHFWLARVMLTAGFQIVSVAIGWQIYALSGRVFDLGLVGLLQFLPRIALVLVAGAAADHLDRRSIAAVSMALQAFAAALLGAASMGWGLAPSRALIFAVAVLLGACRAFDMPAMQALLPALVPKEQQAHAIGLSASATQAAIIVGPALGGLVYAFGAGAAYALNALLDIVGLVLLLGVAVPAVTRQVARPSLASMLEGIRYIRGERDLLGAISLDLFAVLLGGATALLPVFARDILHTGPWGLGLLRAAPAVGALAVAVWLGHHPIERRAGAMMFGCVAVFGAATVVFAVSTSLMLSLATLMVLGAADSVSVVIRGTLVQLETPDALRGRVSAVNSLFIGASNQLGEFESGVTAAWLGTVPAVALGGIGTLLVVGLWMRWFPGLRARDRLLRG